MSTKMTPQLRFPEFTDEWQVKKLGDAELYVADGNYGEMYPKSSEMKDTGIPFIRANNLKNGRLIWQDMKYISPELHQVLKSGHLKTNDILITTRGDIGTTAFVTKDFDNANINAQICLLRSGDKLIPEFVFQTLQTRNSKKQVMSLQTGSALKQLPKGKLALIRFGIPSKPEQEKIADFLTAVDERIAVGEKKLELLETYKRGVMQKIFSQQIRFKDANGNAYPDWEEKKAGALFRNISNRKHNGELPVLSITQDEGVVQRDSLERKINQSDTGVKNYKIIEPKDFVISLRSFQGGIEMSNILGISSPAYTVLRGGSETVPEMFKHYFKRDEFISKLNSTVIGIRDGKQISYEPFSTLKLSVPCIEEQQKIATFLTTLDDKITAEKSKLTATREFKKALLQRMFV